ncbi:MAG: hypothetical protein WAT09_01230 [Paracoccaceae bacterium]
MSLDAYNHIARAPSADAPLVFTFHGTGGDEHQFPGLIRQILPDAGIVAPRGDVPNMARTASFAAPARAFTTWTTLRPAPKR